MLIGDISRCVLRDCAERGRLRGVVAVYATPTSTSVRPMDESPKRMGRTSVSLTYLKGRCGGGEKGERGRGVEGGEGLREGGVREGERMC